MKLQFKLLWWWLALPLLAGCVNRGHGPSPGLSSTTGDARVLFNSITSTNRIHPDWLAVPADLFRLGPGDTIEIEMLGEPGSQATVLVGPDGKVYYSLLAGTFVWGLTLTEAKVLLESNLARLLRNKPEVALLLRGVGSRRMWILGAVQKPGVYPLATPMTLLEAIAAAGGAATAPGAPEETADLENSFVVRSGQLIGVDFSKLLRQGDLSQNIYLQSDDFVYLRSAVSRGDIYVLGAVALPNMVDYREHSSLLSAIASAGGPIEYAYLSHVAIIRGSLAHPTLATFEYSQIARGKALDVHLEPGDIVYVPFSPYRKVEQFLDEILNNFVRTVAINEGQRAVIQGAAPVGVTVPLTGK